MENGRVLIPGSETKPTQGLRSLPVDSAAKEITVTLVLRRNPHPAGPSEADLLSGRYRLSSEGQAAARAAITATPEDIEAIGSFAAQNGLTVLSADAASRRVRLQGSVTAIERAFGVELQETADHHLTYTGAVSVPRELDGVIVAALGLDQRPIAAPRDQ